MVDDGDVIEAVYLAFERKEAIYIAYGRHPSAAVRAADKVFLLASFSDDEVKIIDYNRPAADLCGLAAEPFL